MPWVLGMGSSTATVCIGKLLPVTVTVAPSVTAVGAGVSVAGAKLRLAIAS